MGAWLLEIRTWGLLAVAVHTVGCFDRGEGILEYQSHPFQEQAKSEGRILLFRVIIRKVVDSRQERY